MRRALPLALAVGSMFLALAALGVWQLERRAEKHAFVAALERAAVAAPGPPPPPDRWTALADDDPSYFKRVALRGRFLDDRTVFVRTTVPAGGDESAIGFYVLTPLELASGGAVFVNRGAVAAGRDFRPPPAPPLPGERDVVGFLRPPERGGLLLPADDAARREFSTRDPARLNAAAKLPALAPFVVDAEPGLERAAGGPAGLDPRAAIAAIPDNHLQYAFTWFGLALALIGVYVALLGARRADRGASAL